MDLISIIIPVYNVEQYLSRCLDSVIVQSYSNIEIIVINDGSTDSSGIICDIYAEKDNRIKVIHQSNKGLSAALNVGLDKATGSYIGFVDSDDWIEPDMYELLHAMLKDLNVPICAAGYYKAYDKGSRFMNNAVTISDGIISTEDMLLYPLKRDDYMGFCGYVWNKLYSAGIINKYNKRFDENIRYGMDVLFFASTVITGKCTGAYINKPLYHYYQRDTAISKTKSVDIRQDILTAYKKVENLLDENGYSNISYWARGFYCYHACVAAEIALENNDSKAFSFLQDEVRSHLDDYIRTNEGFTEKIERMYGLLNR